MMMKTTTTTTMTTTKNKMNPLTVQNGPLRACILEVFSTTKRRPPRHCDVGANAADDDDSDGLSNRTEYMLGGNPTDAGSAPRPLFSFAGTGSGATPSYTVSRNLAASDLAPEIQFSTDLADWSTHPPVFISSVKQPDGTAILTYQSPWTVDGNPRGFFRTIESAP